MGDKTKPAREAARGAQALVQNFRDLQIGTRCDTGEVTIESVVPASPQTAKAFAAQALDQK